MPDTKPVILAPIILKAEANTLGHSKYCSKYKAVTFKEDTTEYKASNYAVRENAPIEDVIKKLPGVDVDVNGNITTQGNKLPRYGLTVKILWAGDVQSLSPKTYRLMWLKTSK